MLYIYCRYEPAKNQQLEYLELLKNIANLNGVEIFYDEWVAEEFAANYANDFIDFAQRATPIEEYNLINYNLYKWEKGTSEIVRDDSISIFSHIVDKENYKDHECLLVQNFDEAIYILCDDVRENISSFTHIDCCSTLNELNEWYKNNYEVAETATTSRLSSSQTALTLRSRFDETKMVSIQGTRIYRELQTNYWLHLDNFHRNEEAHIEVYRKDFTFIGTYDLRCNNFTPRDKKKKGRKLKIKS
jgi:hypothetical protein